MICLCIMLSQFTEVMSRYVNQLGKEKLSLLEVNGFGALLSSFVHAAYIHDRKPATNVITAVATRPLSAVKLHIYYKTPSKMPLIQIYQAQFSMMHQSGVYRLAHWCLTALQPASLWRYSHISAAAATASRAGIEDTSLPLQRLQQSITPQACAELAARVSVVTGIPVTLLRITTTNTRYMSSHRCWLLQPPLIATSHL